MAIDEYLEPEVGVAVAVSAVVFSPPVRRVVRRGAVYGLAGILMAGDELASLAGGIGRGVRQAAPAGAGDAVPGADAPGIASAQIGAVDTAPGPTTPGDAAPKPPKSSKTGKAGTSTNTDTARKTDARGGKQETDHE